MWDIYYESRECKVIVVDRHILGKLYKKLAGAAATIYL